MDCGDPSITLFLRFASCAYIILLSYAHMRQKGIVAMPEVSSPYVLELTLEGICVTEQIINVFHYASTSIDDGVPAMLTAFQAAVLALLPAVTGVSTLYTAVRAQGVKGFSEFAADAISVPGVVSGDQCPPYVSWDFTIIRQAARERNGYKRFAGVPESKQANGVASGGALGDLAALASAMGAPISTINDDWEPVIKRTRVNKVTQNPPKYYGFSTVAYAKVGSQNSRKFGHGR